MNAILSRVSERTCPLQGLFQRLNACASGGGRIQRVHQPGLPESTGPPFGCSNSLQANLCAKREVARAADAIRAWQTSAVERSRRQAARTCRPPQPRRKAPLDDLKRDASSARVTPGILPSALRASLSAVPNRSRRFGQHRREHVRPLWRLGADRGQHRRTHRHPHHSRPIRKARRAGESALPPRPARTACCSRVTPAGHDAEGETRQDHTKRP